MFLSIIIPHYNLPCELLERCIASIVQQGIASDEYEIIVVDDASQEPPLWVEKSFPGIDIRLITAKHGGPGAARNRGIEEAKGIYIHFIDADDMLIPGSCYKQCIDKLHREMPQILRFKYRVVKPGMTPQIEKSQPITFSNTTSGAAYMRDFNLSGSSWTYFFQRKLAVSKEIRFPENIFHEDEEFNTILHYHATTLIHSNAVLYRYCIREGSTTANSSAQFETKRIDDMLRVIERIGHFRNAYSRISNPTQTRGLDHKYTMLGVDAILNMLYNGMDAKSIIDKCNEHLAPIGLYPLPKANYSIKYRLFRILANSNYGMRILRAIISSKKPAKQ